MPKPSRRNTILIAIATILVLLNIARWVGLGRAPSAVRPDRGTFIDAQDLQVKVTIGPDGDIPPLRRDLFHPHLPPPKPKVVLVKPQGPPPKTPEQIEQEAAQAELAQIRCAATARRGKKWQAFLTQTNQVYLVSIGDRVGSRFVVEDIAGDGVYLKDPKTNIAGRIQITGR